MERNFAWSMSFGKEQANLLSSNFVGLAQMITKKMEQHNTINSFMGKNNLLEQAKNAKSLKR